MCMLPVPLVVSDTFLCLSSISCADVLAKEGEVHVALCRGQGGTRADKPQREWHNSWQVVAMAALGGFILSDVYPFSCEAVPGYKCTGYR